MIWIDIDMPLGCIYEGKNGKTEYCPLCNHNDVPFCQYIEDEPEAVIGIDERPCYCPLSAQPERTGRWIHQAKFGRIECTKCGKVYRNAFAPKNYCPNCGAKMEEKHE